MALLRPAPAAALLAAHVALACDPDAALARRHWLHTTLVLDNQVFLEVDPDLAGGKFAKMALDRHAFFRGTVGNYARDVAQAGAPGYRPTAYLPAAAADLALIGDPHLENIGTYRPADGRLRVDFNDLDAAAYGPYHLDVRRLAVAVAIAGGALGDAAPVLDEAAQDAALDAALRGYVDELLRLAAAGAPPAPLFADDPALGVILRDLVKKAAEDGGAREELADYTRVEAGARRLAFGEVEPARRWAAAGFEQVVYEDALVPILPEEAWLIDPVLDTYPATLADPAALPPGALAVKGVARRLGAGVASYPVRRYYVLVEGPSADLGDDWILELKQIYDPLQVPALEQAATRPFADNGERLLFMHRALQSGPAVDPLFGVGRAGDLHFRVRERTKYQRGLDLARIAGRLADGRFRPGDFVDLAGAAGALLARAHARAPTRSGRPALPAIAALLAADSGGFIAETRDFARDYALVVDADRLHLADLMAAHGPRLGYHAR